MRLSRGILRRCKPENVLRLARALGLKHLDTMSHKQVCSLIIWLITRREKRERGLID